MGLFGLFYATFCLGCKGVLGVQNFLEDEDHKTRYRNDETNTYLDHNMTKRDISNFFPIYVKEYEEKMAEPFSTWYKQHLYYDRTVRYLADSTKEKFIDEYEEKVRYRRYGELKNN